MTLELTPCPWTLPAALALAHEIGALSSMSATNFFVFDDKAFTHTLTHTHTHSYTLFLTCFVGWVSSDFSSSHSFSVAGFNFTSASFLVAELLAADFRSELGHGLCHYVPAANILCVEVPPCR